MRTKLLYTLPFLLLASQSALAEENTAVQLIQQVINHYPAIKSAYIEVANAEQENLKVQGMTGWQLGAQTAFNKEVSLFGSPVNQAIVGGNLNKLLDSGDRISISAQLTHEDADESLIPTLPNPSTSSELKFEYIKPLGKGADNIEYQTGLLNASAGVRIKAAERQILLDDMAGKIVDLYISAISTQLQIENTEESIKRTKKLTAFIRDRFKLGIVEDKDLLQTDAQLQSQKAQLSTLKLAWTQQQISINRLIGQPWHKPVSLSLPDLSFTDSVTVEDEVKKVSQHNPSIQQLDSLISIAENTIKIQQQNTKDQLDLKFYIGNKTSEGDTTSGSINNSDVVAGVALDYQQSVDKTADNAALYQAQLERGLQLQNKKLLLENLQFDVASLIAEIKSTVMTIRAYQASKNAEVKKLKDAEQRYKSGRIDIDVLLQFENQLAATDLALKLQKNKLQQILLKRIIKNGDIWKNITLPVYDFENDDSLIGEGL